MKKPNLNDFNDVLSEMQHRERYVYPTTEAVKTEVEGAEAVEIYATKKFNETAFMEHVRTAKTKTINIENLHAFTYIKWLSYIIC